MELFEARKCCLLLYPAGEIHYPFSKFLTCEFNNPHTRELASQALRIFLRFCEAHRIELCTRSIHGHCLTYDEARRLADLCYRPLSEIEAISDRKVISLTSSRAGRAPQDLPRAVEPNTAAKRLSYIAKYINFYLYVFLEPNISSPTVRHQLSDEYKKVSHQLRTTVGGTKQGHHHDIKSLPSDRFLSIIRAVFTRPEELFLNASGKPSRTVLRDRAMTLLACEGLRPGTLGNIVRADFRREAGYLVVTDNRAKRTERVTAQTPVLKLGATTQVNSASETMIQLWPFTTSAILDYINSERDATLSKSLVNRSRGFLFLNEKGLPIRHRASITKMFNRLGQRLAALGMLDVGTDPYFPKQKQYDFYGYVLRHSSASLFLQLKGTDDRALDQMKPRYGWTIQSKQPQRYAARALSDQGNIDLMKFNTSLMEEMHAKLAGVGEH